MPLSAGAEPDDAAAPGTALDGESEVELPAELADAQAIHSSAIRQLKPARRPDFCVWANFCTRAALSNVIGALGPDTARMRALFGSVLHRSEENRTNLLLPVRLGGERGATPA